MQLNPFTYLAALLLMLWTLLCLPLAELQHSRLRAADLRMLLRPDDSPGALSREEEGRNAAPKRHMLTGTPAADLFSAGPLLQVDYTGFSTINAQRFGQRFVGKVANPHDILLWHKAPVRKAKVGLLHVTSLLSACCPLLSPAVACCCLLLPACLPV